MTGTGRTTVRKRALALSATNLAVGLAMIGLAHRAGASALSLPRLGAFAVAFALVGLFPMRLDFGRHQVTFTLTDAVLVASLFSMGPLGVAFAAVSGEAIACVALRMAPLKVLFNTTNRLAAAAVAGVAFFTFDSGGGAADFHVWVVAFLAAVTFAVLDIASVTAIVAAADERRYQDILVRSVPIAVLTTLAAAPLGLVVVDLFRRGPFAPVLLAPLGAAVAMNGRYAAHQRDEHLRIERLFAATSRTARLVGFTDATAAVAAESRQLLTGSAALCCVATPSGDWVGVVADDDGVRAASAVEVDCIAGLVAERGPCELGAADVPPAIRSVAPDAPDVVVACAPEGSPMPVAIAVFRGQGSDEQRRGRVETLTAFATQASLTVGNARLYEEVEEALRKQVDLNRQKSDFVASVSHELRTPLTAMSGAVATVLRLDGRLNDNDRLRLLKMAVDQGGRLKRLIDDLLLVAAAEHTRLRCEPSDIATADLVEALTGELHGVLAGRLRVCADGAPDVIRSDEGRLRQVLVNLLENAAKYAPEGPVELRIEPRDDQLHLAVVDHGPGIAPEDRSRAFERFVQLDQSSTRRQGGTGLGLYLCDQLTQVLGGTLTLTDTPGGGCTFTLSIPMAGPGATSSSARNPRPTMAKRPAGLPGAPGRTPAAAPQSSSPAAPVGVASPGGG